MHMQSHFLLMNVRWDPLKIMSKLSNGHNPDALIQGFFKNY